MHLISVQCSTRVGKLLNLNAHYHRCLLQHTDLLSKYTLHPMILSLNSPIQHSTSKAINNFLDLFHLRVLSKGKLLSTEIGRQPTPTILVKGEIMAYKRIVQFHSMPFESKDKDRALLQQG